MNNKHQSRFSAVFTGFFLLFFLIDPVMAEAVVRDFKVSRRGDTELSCGSLSKEATIMRDIIFTTQDIQNQSAMKSKGISAAGTAASFLIGTVTGGIGIAAAGFLMDHNVEVASDNAENIQDIAQQRRSLMMGIYNAKGCFGPMDHAMQNPQRFDFFDSISSIEPAAGEEESIEINPQYNQ